MILTFVKLLICLLVVTKSDPFHSDASSWASKARQEQAWMRDLKGLLFVSSGACPVQSLNAQSRVMLMQKLAGGGVAG